MPNRAVPLAFIGKGVDLVFDLILLAKTHHVPAWLRQTIEL